MPPNKPFQWTSPRPCFRAEAASPHRGLATECQVVRSLFLELCKQGRMNNAFKSRLAAGSLAILLGCTYATAAPATRQPEVGPGTTEPCRSADGLLLDTLALTRIPGTRSPKDFSTLAGARSDYAADQPWFRSDQEAHEFGSIRMWGARYIEFGIASTYAASYPGGSTAEQDRIIRIADHGGVPIYIRETELGKERPILLLVPAGPVCWFLPFQDRSTIQAR